MDKQTEENLERGRLLINRLEEMQYSYFNGRPKWIPLQSYKLKLFIAHMYYGFPSASNAIVENNHEDNVNCEIIFEFYKNEIKKKVLEVIEKINIYPGCSDIKVGMTMVHSICKKNCDVCHQFPDKDIHQWMLLRLKLFDDICIFIDFQNSRIYKGWDNYITNNNLPEGFMFYPESGFYDASQMLYQNLTPASKPQEKIKKIIDITAKLSSMVTCITLGCGSIFFLGTPVLLVSGVILISSSSYHFYRGIGNLVDMYKYDTDVSGIKSCKKWIDLSIAAVGAIAAPFQTIAAISSEINATVQTSKVLNIFQKSSYITQCTLECVRATLDFIDDNFKITFENVLKIRLDLLLVTGLLMSSSYIKEILKILAVPSVWLPIYKTLEEIPYCLAQYLWKSVYFFKKHFAVFVERVTMFLAENLTVENLLFAWQIIHKMFVGHQKQIAQLDVGDLLRHVVQGTAEHPSVMYVLRGDRMVKLLYSLRECSPKKPINRALVKYCVDYVLREAKKLSANRDHLAVIFARRGETRWGLVDKEFCKCYGIESCTMDQYVLWAIGEVSMNTAALMAEYEEYSSRPENMFNDEMVVSESNGAGYSAKGYSFVMPCGVLDLEMSLRFANMVNPQPHKYLDHKFVQPKPSVSLMFGVSAYTVNIVFFGLDLVNGVPKMNICFFQQNRDSLSSIADKNSLRKLQAA